MIISHDLDEVQKLCDELLKTVFDAVKPTTGSVVLMQSIEQLIRDLSGGNKQKVVIAKWLANDSKIFIMDCPARGIDIGVKAKNSI